MTPITYKQVLDSSGALTGLELWQDGRHITVSLAAPGTTQNGYRWIEVKDTVDRLAEKAHRDVQAASNLSDYVPKFKKERL